jgi:multisubunit Na+/H+ antiporter MnhF subunit
MIVVCGALLSKDDIFLKLLFLNTGTSLASLFICFLGSVKANSSYFDIALIYFLLSVISSSAYLKYCLQKSQMEENGKI